jgi:hypothetical protein
VGRGRDRRVSSSMVDMVRRFMFMVDSAGIDGWCRLH